MDAKLHMCPPATPDLPSESAAAQAEPVGNAMQNERFNLSLRRFLKEVGISSQQEIERLVRDRDLAGKGKLRVKIVLTAEGTDLRHEVEGAIDLD
jgi:hypothetical protein